ncbi:MAG: tetratricopeptide repeat protein [Candidatus Obscuribacterales bacterium]|nr:tetratricopeptide repeat protein [Candidatus Obscuribacterales bacterium]
MQNPAKASLQTIILAAGLIITALSPPAVSARGDKATVEPAELNMRTGLTNMRNRDYEAAADNFLQSVYFSRNHYNPQAYLYYAMCLKAQRKYAKAIEAYKEHLKQTTENAANARVDLAECYMEINEMDQAREQIDKARGEADYNEKRPIYAMGEMSEKLGDLGPALESYLAALDQKPWKYTEAWLGAARIYVKLGDYNRAIAEYKDIINSTIKNVNWTEVYYNYGNCLYKRGDHQGAIDRWLYAIKADPDAFDCHVALASVFDEEKHLSSAIKEYESAVRCAPKGYDLTKINQRMLFLQSKLQQQEARKEVKPSPYMRQQEEQQNAPQSKKPPVDSGF